MSIHPVRWRAEPGRLVGTLAGDLFCLIERRPEGRGWSLRYAAPLPAARRRSRRDAVAEAESTAAGVERCGRCGLWLAPARSCAAVTPGRHVCPGGCPPGRRRPTAATGDC